MGEHKGYALAFAAELLAGVLSGGGTIHPDHPRQHGITNHMMSVLIDPARLVDLEWMKREIDATIAYALASPPQDPSAPVLAPGDPERIATRARRQNGIPIDDQSWDQILAAAESLGLRSAELDALLAP
jgi:uncharacterized oxidoreductase